MLPRVKKMWNEYRHMNYLKLNGGVDPCEALRARVARLEDALRFILDECDWEPTHHESGGDERIGAAARRALEEK